VVESPYHGHVVVDALVLRRCFLEYPRFHSIAPLGNTTESNAGRGGESDRGARKQTEIHFYIVAMTLIYKHR
jgi:hypothetical protein